MCHSYVNIVSVVLFAKTSNASSLYFPGLVIDIFVPISTLH